MGHNDVDHITEGPPWKTLGTWCRELRNNNKINECSRPFCANKRTVALGVDRGVAHGDCKYDSSQATEITRGTVTMTLKAKGWAMHQIAKFNLGGRTLFDYNTRRRERERQWAHPRHGFGTVRNGVPRRAKRRRRAQCNLNGVKPSFCLGQFGIGLTEHKISALPMPAASPFGPLFLGSSHCTMPVAGFANISLSPLPVFLPSMIICYLLSRSTRSRIPAPCQLLGLLTSLRSEPPSTLPHWSACCSTSSCMHASQSLLPLPPTS